MRQTQSSRTDAIVARDTRRWHERQPRVLWRLVFDSGHVAQADAYECMQVCRLWHGCVNGASKLWRRIDLPRQRGLDMHWVKGITEKRPKEIVLDHHRSQNATRRQLSAILERNPQLKRVRLYYTRVRIARALDSIRSPLTALHLLGCNGLDDAAFAQIVHGAPMLKRLKTLQLGLCPIGDATARLIAAEFTQLSAFGLWMSIALTSSGVRHLSADGAHTQRTLRELELCDCKSITDDVSECMLAMPNLETLSVERVPVCTDEWASALEREYSARHRRQIVVVSHGRRPPPLLRPPPP